MGPLSKLGLVLLETLDPHSETILVTLTTFGNVLHNRRRWGWDKVCIFAANIKKSGTLAVFWAEDPKTIPDVDQASSVRDNCSVVALVVWHALIALTGRVVGTVLKDVVHLGRGNIAQLLAARLLVVIGGGQAHLVLNNVIFAVFKHLSSEVSKDIIEDIKLVSREILMGLLGILGCC
jgi:hypothetical protein